MKIYKFPTRGEWNDICARPLIDSNDLSSNVMKIMDKVKREGDRALIDYTKEFDNCVLEDLEVMPKEFLEADKSVPNNLKEAIRLAKSNIEAFHKSQIVEELVIETRTGVKCWRKSVGIETIGLYIPGGTAPLFSTILMLAIPAHLAGCKELILVTPPSENGFVNQAILYTAKLVGIKRVFKLGGAQAIAAMTYGTESVPAVLKIFGPGNQYVNKAKEFAQLNGVAIDLPAGPSELLIIADDTCNVEYVAADLLSQAEHGTDSQVILLTTSEKLLNEIQGAINEQLKQLPRKDIIEVALANSRMVLLKEIDACIELSNYYAPEHLILASDKAAELIDGIVNAGSVFIGNYSCESAGDYASGTNHTLPTNGFAKNYSGVSVDSFVKKITFQEITAQGIQEIGPAIELMAQAEELNAHKNAVSIRLKDLRNV